MPGISVGRHQQDTRWQRAAACRDTDGDWDIEPSGKPTPDNLAALDVCAACPVREACLDFVLAPEGAWPRWGVWGGKLPAEREELAPSWRTRRQGSARAD